MDLDLDLFSSFIDLDLDLFSSLVDLDLFLSPEFDRDLIKKKILTVYGNKWDLKGGLF